MNDGDRTVIYKEGAPDAIQHFGYEGDPVRLCEAIDAARRGPCAGKAATEIVYTPPMAAQLCEAVRQSLGESVPDYVILRTMLLWMPRTCGYCGEEDEPNNFCDECDGCSACCQSEIHCDRCCHSLEMCPCQ